jgi:hypothetical protein
MQQVFAGVQAVKALQVGVKTQFLDWLKAFADIVGKVASVFEEEPFKSLAGVIDIKLMELPRIEISTQDFTFNFVVKEVTVKIDYAYWTRSCQARGIRIVLFTVYL